MFENKVIKGIYISRYVASWTNAGGKRKGFKNWLRTLVIDGEHLTEEEIYDIYAYATNGKLELEDSAREYLKANNG